MNRLASLLSFLLLAIAVSSGQDMLPAPGGIVVNAFSSSVDISWEMVEGATGYMVKIENVTEQTPQTNQITISGLMPKTDYTVVIYSVNGTMVSDEMAFADFRTMLPEVQNIMVSLATETSIEITWEAVEDAVFYTVIFKATDADEATELTVTELSITLTGLSSMTFYDISIAVEGETGSSSPAMFKARTDGSGVTVTNLWESAQAPFGGEILVFRPLTIPKGAYAMRIDIPCPVQSVEVWDADMNNQSSMIEDGVIVISQTASWQLQKTEVALNLNFDEEVNCSLASDQIMVQFGIDVPENEVAVQTIEVPVVPDEWLDITAFEAFQAGLVQVRLNEVFKNPNSMGMEDEKDDLENKPPMNEFVIALIPGPECPGGINVRKVWSMTPKDVEGIEGALPGVSYFVQHKSQWYSNEAGFLYGYDPTVCPNRSGVRATVMAGGDFVQSIVEAPDATME